MADQARDVPAGLAELKQAYLEDLLAGKRKGALDRIMAAFRNGCPIPDIYTEVFQESLYEVGRLWERNQISVADEHMSTAITQFIMSNLYQHLDIAAVRRGRVVITGVQGELHQVGANMVADVLEADGWTVKFLGANVPPESVVLAIRQDGADLLGISATMSVNFPKVVHLVEMVRTAFGPRAPRILLGGGAFLAGTPLPSGLAGCLVARNLREAQEAARRPGG